MAGLKARVKRTLDFLVDRTLSKTPLILADAAGTAAASIAASAINVPIETSTALGTTLVAAGAVYAGKKLYENRHNWNKQR